MKPRVCGTCKWARDEGDGKTICTHEGGHHCTVIITACKQPRRWWDERREPIRAPARAVEVTPQIVEDEGGQLRLEV